MGLRTTGIVLVLPFLLPAQSKRHESAIPQPNPAAAAPEALPFVTCPAGSPIGTLDLRVQAGDQRLPFRTINRLGEGDALLYAPVLRGKEKRPGEIALVLVPQKREPGQEDILVTDPKPADRPQTWKMTQTISVVALVYGPSGLSRKKVANFLSQDEVLIAQLADYADKTAQAEQLVAALSNSESSSASVNAALNGFASQYGFAVQVNGKAPVAQQAATVFSAMNPKLAAYDPLSGSTAQRTGQTASLAAMAGTLFFGSPIGLATGGTAILLDLRALAFPDTQFRASFAKPLADSGLTLCGQQGPLPPHTRAAYIWGSRIPNISAPAIRIDHAGFLPNSQKTPLPVDVPEPGWKYLDRVREWTLANHQEKVRVPVVKLGNLRALEIDLTKVKVPPGDYKLTGYWDWSLIEADGTVHILPLSDFKSAHLDPASQDSLLTKSGRIPVTLTGSDFEFITKIELQKANDEFAMPEGLRFLLPRGLREGPQDRVDVQIDTQELDPGPYKLLISQNDGKTQAIDFKVLPNPPKLGNLPILANQGSATQHFVLKGERLELVRRLEAPGAVLELGPAGRDQTERSLTVELKSSPPPGTALPVTAYLADRSEPITFPGGLDITGPLPVIASSKLSLPKGLSIAVHPDEFPAGYTLNAMLDVKNIKRQSVLRLACADGVGQTATLQIGGQTAVWSLQQLSPDQLFLAFETSNMPAGCLLQGEIDNGRDGRSRPFTLAHILRVPRIDSFTLADTPPDKGGRQYQITGQNLEMIEKAGWDESDGRNPSGLPAPLTGPGLRQSIQVDLPDPPAPEAPLYVWLWGSKQARVTAIKAPALPLQAPQGTVQNSDSRTPAAISLASTLDHSRVGQPVTFVARVSPASATGTVTFGDGLTPFGTATLSSGQATLTTSTLPSGSLSIVATYGGDAVYAATTSPPLMQTVSKWPTTTSINTEPNPSAAGQQVIFKALVIASSSATGTIPGATVSFKEGNVTIGTAILDSMGIATFSTTNLSVGQHNVQAEYSGSAAFAASTSPPITQIVQ